jgi:hypothetical protein
VIALPAGVHLVNTHLSSNPLLIALAQNFTSQELQLFLVNVHKYKQWLYFSGLTDPVQRIM